MNATTRLTPPAQKQTFSNAITSNAMQGLIQKSLKDEKVVARFTSTLISAVNSSEQLKECDPGTIVAAALRGEGMGLNLNIGYYLVPYGQTCTFVIGYKGLIALALATGQYTDIDCMDIREGEYPAVDVMQELRKMAGWCESNTTKRKTRRGVRAFITSWLARAQDRGGSQCNLRNTNQSLREASSSNPFLREDV